MPSSSATEARRLPKTFVIELTSRCNHRCQYCYAVWGQHAAAAARPDGGGLPTDSVKAIVAKLQDEAPVENIAFSGGEPLLRDDLSELVSYVHGRDLAPVVITNGTLLTPERTATLTDAAALEVTLLSHHPEVHDRLVGRRGAWAASVDGMANARQAGCQTVAVFVATRANWRDLEKTVELAIALGAYGVMYNRLNLSAQNFHAADRLLPTPRMVEANLEVLEMLAVKYSLPVAVAVVIEPCVVDVRRFPHVHFGWCPLAGEGSYFTIGPAGEVRICNHSPTVLGNILQDSFRDIYDRHPYVRAFRDTWPRECAECPDEWRALCGGGCKAAAEQCYGTLDRVDPFVTLSGSANDRL